MNRDGIIRMARQTGASITVEGWHERVLYSPPGWLKRFARSVAAAERKACAEIADAEASIEGIGQRIAAAIRARGQA